MTMPHHASYLLQEYQGMRWSYQTATFPVLSSVLEYLVMLRQECLVFRQGGGLELEWTCR